jgi:hypothetical protein
MLMVLTKLLPAAEVGYYVLGLAITVPVILFSMLQLRAVQVTDARNLNKFEDFFWGTLNNKLHSYINCSCDISRPCRSV